VIVITKMKIGDYEVPVPRGLSELLQGSWVEQKSAPSVNGYERKVEMRNGRLYTVLKKKQVPENAKIS